MNRLDEFLSGLDDGWRLEGIGDAPIVAGRKPGLPTITWVRQYLRKHGASPAPIVIAAGIRCGYSADLIEGAVYRNRQWFTTGGGLWGLRPTSVEWLSDFLIINGECPSADVLKAGEEAGFKASTIGAAKSEVVGFHWRRGSDGTVLWSVRR